MQKKIGIISQARTTSTRLPGKVLMKAGGKTILEHGLDRLKWSEYPIYVATTINHADNEIVHLCEKNKVFYYRGSEHDVLSRYYECAKKFSLDVVVRVTSDNPLIDGDLIREGIQRYLELPDNSYVSNCLENPYPHGFNFEIFSFDALKNAHLLARESFEREHVTPFILNPSKNTGVIRSAIEYRSDAIHFRLTVDEADDWALMKILLNDYHAFTLSCAEITCLLKNNASLANINSHVKQIKV